MTITAESDALWELVGPDAQVERLATGFTFTEGPIWNAKGSFLLFSDIPADVRRRWDEHGGVEEVLRPSNKANGLTYDARGTLVVCEHATSSVVRERGDGSGRDRAVLASHYRGKELNSPNDVVVSDDGSIYFTDPSYGRMAVFGVEREPELGFQGVYRIPPDGSDLQLLVDDFAQPNGLCFAPQERLLYVNDSERAHVRVFNVRPDGSLGSGDVFFEGIRSDVADGVPDGMKCDERGNLLVTGPGGVWVLAPDGTRLGIVDVPEKVANLNWGGDQWSELYLTSTTSLYRVRLRTRGNPVSFMDNAGGLTAPS